MLTIIDFAKRTNAEGEPFYALILQGGISMVQSKESGQFYATARKTSVSSTFDEKTCMGLIGTKLEGSIAKVQCEPYTYVIEQTGEEITLDYRWRFVPPTDNETEKAVFGEKAAVGAF
jgi:hypothetical protein